LERRGRTSDEGLETGLAALLLGQVALSSMA